MQYLVQDLRSDVDKQQYTSGIIRTATYIVIITLGYAWVIIAHSVPRFLNYGCMGTHAQHQLTTVLCLLAPDSCHTYRWMVRV